MRISPPKRRAVQTDPFCNQLNFMGFSKAQIQAGP
jgi:hypothetical protein